MFHFIQYRKIFYIISGIAVVLSITAMFVFGLNLGIEFQGGSLMEVSFQDKAPAFSDIQAKLAELNLGEIVLQQKGEKGLSIKMKSVEEKVYQTVLAKLAELSAIEEGSADFQAIGAVVGQELKNKTILVTILSLLVILIYIAVSFRRISRPVKSYIYGLSGILALVHDIIIPLGIFAVLGRYYGAEITIPIITAFLTIFGYSINDTVVVFDRIRENLLKMSSPSFELAIDKSLNETMRRSLHTSFTTLLALFAIYFFGGESLRYFSLALIIGISSGVYSSVFIASPLLADYLRFKERKYRGSR